MDAKNSEPRHKRLWDRPGLITVAGFWLCSRRRSRRSFASCSCCRIRIGSGLIGGGPMTTSCSLKYPDAKDAISGVTCVGFWFSGRSTAKSKLPNRPRARGGWCGGRVDLAFKDEVLLRIWRSSGSKNNRCPSSCSSSAALTRGAYQSEI
jgi:hypothetical protein